MPIFQTFTSFNSRDVFWLFKRGFFLTWGHCCGTLSRQVQCSSGWNKMCLWILMKLENSWIVQLALLRENESSSDSRRRADLGERGQHCAHHGLALLGKCFFGCLWHIFIHVELLPSPGIKYDTVRDATWSWCPPLIFHFVTIYV